MSEVVPEQAPDRHELWLAEDRNYLPVRKRYYTLRWSTLRPIVEGAVDELRELKPGVWFPFAAHLTSYQPIALQGGRQLVQWRWKYQVVDASLDPHYAAACFRDLDFPRRTRVPEDEDAAEK